MARGDLLQIQQAEFETVADQLRREAPVAFTRLLQALKRQATPRPYRRRKLKTSR